MYRPGAKYVCVTGCLNARADVMIKPGYKFVSKSCRMNIFRNGLCGQNERMETCGVMKVQKIGTVASAKNLDTVKF
jgi:hypothetical protein